MLFVIKFSLTGWLALVIVGVCMFIFMSCLISPFQTLNKYAQFNQNKVVEHAK